MGFRTGVQFPSPPPINMEKALIFQGFFLLQKEWVSKSSQKSSQANVCRDGSYSFCAYKKTLLYNSVFLLTQQKSSDLL